MWRSTCPNRSSTCTLSESLPVAASTASATLVDRDVDAGRDVDDLAGERVDVGGDDRLDRLGVVVHVEPVAARVAVTVDRQRFPGQRLGDEARHDLLRVLPRAVVVERADDHDRQPVRDEVRVRQPVAARLGRRVRRSRVQRVLLVHGRALGRAVDLARGDQDEALDGVRADGVEEDLRPLDVRRHELRGALLDRLLDVRLGGGIHDHVHLRDDVGDELGVADVAVDEREPLVAEHVREVLEVTRVRQRVERDDVVRGVREQVPDDVRRDETGAAGDEDAPRQSSSSSIVYSGFPSTSRWILPRYSPTSARMKPWIPSTNSTATPPSSGPGKSERSIQYQIP